MIAAATIRHWFAVSERFASRCSNIDSSLRQCRPFYAGLAFTQTPRDVGMISSPKLQGNEPCSEPVSWLLAVKAWLGGPHRTIVPANGCFPLPGRERIGVDRFDNPHSPNLFYWRARILSR